MHIAKRLVFLLALGVCAAWTQTPARAAADEQVMLTAAGATFPQPLYQTMIAQFTQRHPNVRINYGGGGSGQGIRGITDKILAFAGSDAPMSPQELQKAGGPDAIIQFPSCAGAVVPAYNVPGMTGDLNFTGEILAGIYLGKISNWNDAKIAAVNPGVALPDLPIVPAWRSDASGTNFVWTSYLCGQSAAFRGKIGLGKQVRFPLGQGGIQNPGIASIVQDTPGALGYIEQNYAEMNGIRFGRVRNKRGNFIKASTEAVTSATANAAAAFSGHVLKANIWNGDGDDDYPIASFTYLIAQKDLGHLRSRQEAQTVVDFFWFATHDGQSSAVRLYYAPLGEPVRKKVEAVLGQFTFNHEPIEPNP